MTNDLFQIAERLLETYSASENGRQHAGNQPSTAEIERIVGALQELMFPGFFGTQGLSGEALRRHVAGRLSWIEIALTEQIKRAAIHGDDAKVESNQTPQELAAAFLQILPQIKQMLDKDVKAAYEGDPAASCSDEVIASYPGVFAIMVYRLAHQLYQLKIPLLPRIMTEYAHRETGIDIHPATEIGAAFFIDHGTGVVIGGTAIIGSRVKLYQGVTLGAFSFPKDKEGNLIRDTKRHPTIEDDVVIYSGATILGGETVIGRGSAIGGNVWLTKSIPPFSKVSQETPNLRIITPEIGVEPVWDYII